MARGGGRLTGSEFFRAIDDLGRRIPLVKLERIEELYPEFQENSRKSVVLSSPPKIQEKKDSHGYTRKLGRKSPRKPETSMLTSSEPPKKQYKLKEETVKKGIDKIIESPNSSPKSTVVIVECDPNALLTLSESDKSTLSLSEGSELCLSQEIYSDSNTSELYSQPQRNEISTKVNTPALWESGNTRVETMSFSGNSGLGANSQTYPETTRRSDSQISENISVRLNPATSTRPTYSGRSESQVNQLSYSNSNINSQMYSGISRSHANSRIYESRESGLNNPTIYSESGASVYSGNSGPSVNSQVYSASSVNSASYSGYNRAALNPPGNNVLSVNTPGYSGNIKSDINTGYSRNNESLNYSGNVRSEMLQPVYYGNNSHELNSQNFSGNNQSRVVAGFSGSSGHCINSQNYSESNTASYSNNSGHAVNSLNYGNKGSAINSEPFSGNRLGVNAQTYVSNSGSSASYTAYGGSAGSSVNSSYSGSGGNGMTTFAGSGGSGINTSAYSGNSASSTCRDMRFSGGSSYSGSENTPQYAVLQNYCGSSESNIDNAISQDGTWSSDYITLNSLPSNGYQLLECSPGFPYLFSCKICGNMSSMADELIKHWRLHTGVDSLTCTMCYVSFTDVLFLQAHWKAIHMEGLCNDTGVIFKHDDKIMPQLTCEACGFAFSHFTALEQHVMATHIAVEHHREGMSWRNDSGGYGVGNVQQNNKSLNDISLTKESSMIDDNIIGSDDEDHTLIELENMERNTIIKSDIDDDTETKLSGPLSSRTSLTKVELDEERGDVPSDLDNEKVTSQNGTLLKCKVCMFSTGEMSEHLRHWRIHIGACSLTCTKCKKTFSDLPFLQAHWRRSHMHGNSVPNSVSNHSLQNQATTFTCDTCGYAFPDFPVLEQHFMSMHVVAGFTQFPLRIRNFADNTQNVSSIQKQNITVNKSKSHDFITHKIQVKNLSKKKEGEEESKGSDEQKREEIRKKLYGDLSVKRTKNRHGCLVCGEASNDMIKHLLSHTGVLSLECCLCGKDFVDVPFLQAHWRATHMNGEVRHTNNGIFVGNYKENISCKDKDKLLCETCGCYVPKLSALEKHIILAHTVIIPPYTCKCEDVFPSEDELKTHISTCSW